jgi:integrase
VPARYANYSAYACRLTPVEVARLSEDWLKSNPALDVKLKAPARRNVIWEPEQSAAYVKQANAENWESIAVMVLVLDSIAQSPVDCRTLKAKDYDGQRINTSRNKTGVIGAPIPLFPEAKAALDSYLAKQPPKLPDAPLFTNDRIGGEWNENTLQKVHRKIRAAAGLPKNLQLQDFRTTAATEAGGSGATRDELRGLLRHRTGAVSEHYVHPDAHFVESVQNKRLVRRNKNGAKVGIPGT